MGSLTGWLASWLASKQFGGDDEKRRAHERARARQRKVDDMRIERKESKLLSNDIYILSSG